MGGCSPARIYYSERKTMSLSATTLSTAIKAAHIAAGAVEGATLTTFSDALALAIVNHLTANATITINTSGLSAGGDPVIGTATGTLT
jgi:hypothetical protein